MSGRRRLLCAALAGLLLASGTLPAAETPLPFAHDLPLLAADAARQGAPFILLVSLSECRFCEKIRREHLLPLSQSGVPVWQIHLDGEAMLVDFSGRRISERQLAKDLKVRVAPSVFVFDAQGRQVAAPLVGTLLDDFYGAYLADAIAAGRAGA